MLKIKIQLKVYFSPEFCMDNVSHHVLTKNSEIDKEGQSSVELLSEVHLDWVRIPVSWSQDTNHQEAVWPQATHITSSSLFSHLKHVLVPDLKMYTLGDSHKNDQSYEKCQPCLLLMVLLSKVPQAL